MSSTLVRGKYVVRKITGPDSADVVSDGAVFQRDGEIVEVGRYEDLKNRHPEAEVIGSPNYVVMPGLVDSHSHLGLTPCQLGALDNTLEIRSLNKLGSRFVDPYLDQMYCAIQMIENGTTTVQALHTGSRRAGPSRVLDTADKALKAFQEIGMRVSYAPMVANQNMYIVGAPGDEKDFAATMPGDLGERFTSYMSAGYAPPEEWMSALEEVAEKYGNDRYERIRVTIAPSNVHRCSDDFLVALKEMATKYQTGIHIHLLESPHQKFYGTTAWNKSPLQHMNDLGFLGPEVVCGHSVWVTDEDLDTMRETGTNICHNASSNLRLQSGIAPITKALQKGIKIGLGIDEATINDNKDMLEEMRLALRLQYTPGIVDISPTSYDVFQMGTENGAYCAWFGDKVGTLDPGKRADLVLLNLSNIEYPYIDPEVSLIDALVYRGRSRDVDTVMIDGDVVMRDGKLTHVDKESLLKELNSALDRPLTTAELEGREMVKQVEPYMRRYLKENFAQDLVPHTLHNARY
ncbi:MAG: amidohydrolase family protein [Chloroflexi bacterium]|nr:amidohydrolase family protein [Chloroflexota bacterium]